MEYYFKLLIFFEFRLILSLSYRTVFISLSVYLKESIYGDLAMNNLP